MALTDNQLRKLDAAQLMPILIEELSETIQAVCKLARNGRIAIDEKTGKKYENFYDVMREFEQVQSAIRFFCSCHGENYGTLMSDISLERNV